MKNQVQVSNCVCGHPEVEIIHYPARALSGVKAACVIKCKKCSFCVTSHDLAAVPTKKLAVFWDSLQVARSKKEIWHSQNEIPPQDDTQIAFVFSNSLLFGTFLGVYGEDWHVRVYGCILKINPDSWAYYKDLNLCC